MKLLLISAKSDRVIGGISVWTQSFLQYCKDNGIACDLINTEIPHRRAQSGKRSLWDESRRTLRMVRALHKHLRETTYDMVYLNTSCGTYGLFRDTLLAKTIHKKGVPFLTHYHCEIPYWVTRRASVRCLGKLSAMSRHNLVLCQNSKAFLKTHYGITSTQVPNFVDESIVRTDAKTISPSVRRVFFTGRITEAKGAKELFDVAHRLPHIQFYCAGNVSNIVKDWDKPGNLHLLGQIPHEQVLSHLDDADLFLFPSHTEGSSIALIESMARGVPVIATDVGANADVVGDRCGIIVPAGHIEAMVNAVSQLESPDQRRQMSLVAVERVREHYTCRCMNDIIALLRAEQNALLF